MTPDPQLLAAFELDAGVSFDALAAGLEELESSGANEENVNALFRAAHNLKGNARTVGFAAVGELAHLLEELLERFRSGKLAPTRRHLTLLGAITETIKAEVGEAIAEIRRGEDVPAGAGARAARRATARGRTMLRVDPGRLDQMLDLVGEVVVGRARVETVLLDAAHWTRAAVLEAHREGERSVLALQELVTACRLVPLGPVLRSQATMIRDLAEAQGKLVRCTLIGDDVEVDAALVESLRDPLTHMVRNSVDHGLETPTKRIAAGKDPCGTIELRARRDGASIILEVADDGRGLSRTKILAKARAGGEALPDSVPDEVLFRRVFAAGFSTAERVTAVSGRGVGLDVVRQNIEALRGSIAIASVEGASSLFTLRIPLTLAMMSAFHVTVGDGRFVLEKQHVRECMTLDEGVFPPGETGMIEIHGAPVPCIRLRETFACAREGSVRESLVLADCGGRLIGLAVDGLHGEAQTVIKPMGRLFQATGPISGSAVLGTGEVALVLDVPALLRTFDSTRDLPSAE